MKYEKRLLENAASSYNESDIMYKLNDITEMIENRLSEIDLLVEPDGLYAPIRYILSLGGKRIRPALMLMAADMFEADLASMINVAMGFEVFHNFTLLHDDLMDKADRRRGNLTVHKKWSDNTAILSGDVMLVVAYKLIATTPSQYLSTILNLFSKTAAEICEGQQYDMEFEQRSNVTLDEYIEMIRLKTAVLLGASLKAGAILAGVGEKDASLLYDFGINIGLAFQIKDDLLDVYGDPKVFGKNIGGDIRCNKKTFVLLKAREKASVTQLEQLDKWMKTIGRDEEKVTAVTAVYNEIGVKVVCEEVMSAYYESAMKCLQAVNVSDERKLPLKQLAEKMMCREL